MDFDLKDLLLVVYATVLFIVKDVASKFKDFVGKYSEIVFDNALYNVKNKHNNLLIQHGLVNTLLADACKEVNSDFGIICMFHNGVAKNFLNYSVRFEYNTSDSIINDYQVKPLSPFYKLLIDLDVNNALLNTEKIPLFIRNTEKSLFYVKGIFTKNKSKVSTTDKDKNMVGVVLIKVSDKNCFSLLDSYLAQIQSVFDKNSKLIF